MYQEEKSRPNLKVLLEPFGPPLFGEQPNEFQSWISQIEKEEKENNQEKMKIASLIEDNQ